MKTVLEPGRYVVAVSGGVDSCVLLDLLMESKRYELIVAHFEHGIRPDSAEDAHFVEQLARQYRLPFFSEAGHLGAAASEATARMARYDFLYRVMAAQCANALITAHHQDDVLETAIINLFRGSGRKGLTALHDTAEVRRPLLGYSKQQLLEHARTHQLTWREDSTNQDTKYLRNYIRLRVLPRFSDKDKQALLAIIERQQALNGNIDAQLAGLPGWQFDGHSIERGWFNRLPHAIAKEVMAAWLRANGLREFDRRTLERIVVAGKVTRPGKQIDILHRVRLNVEKDRLALNGLER